jgi:2,3-bisphosphoglycerate-independent phosphoglycerate mutase
VFRSARRDGVSGGRYRHDAVKYVIIIPDGAADLPIEELDGLTPFQAAETPNLKRLAAMGRVGTAHTTPATMEAGSDVCSMSLLGYDPLKYHTGRAPLEAAALGLDLSPTDWIFRLNLVTVGGPTTGDHGVMLDHSAGAISDAEAKALVGDLLAHWRKAAPELAKDFTLHHGVSYRSILVDRSGRDYRQVRTTPPHAIPNEPWEPKMPEGDASAERLRDLMDMSSEFLAKHPVNRARLEIGLRPGNMAWVWGGGTKPVVPLFKERFGLRGAMITSVDLLAGIAAYLGWERLHVPGLTSYHDTDYAAQGRATCAAVDEFDVVCSHVEAPDESSHQGDWQTKVASLEAIDRHVVGPVLEKLLTLGDPAQDSGAEGWRLLVMPDHYTLVSTRKHDATPVPFLMAGAWVRSVVQRPFTEAGAAESDLHIDPGHDLMEYFLRGGLAGVKSAAPGSAAGPGKREGSR